MSIYLFEEGYFKSDFGRGAAISMLMLLIVAVLSIVYVRRWCGSGTTHEPRSRSGRRAPARRLERRRRRSSSS